jgi:uncharacterized cupredoxin-like copper-binding protein
MVVRSPPRWLLASILSLAVVGLAACPRGEATTVEVKLQEWAVIPAQDAVPAGEITFEVENTGPDHSHELVVIRTDLASDALPTAEDGSVDEDGEGTEVIGELEEFPPGETRTSTFDLEAGTYVLICNVVEEHAGETMVHYAMGMRAPFTVE